MPSLRSHHPPLALMHLSFLYSGAGTLLLGPTLPVFALRWHLTDSQSGLLIAAQFLGLFCGAIALHRNLRLTLLCGYLASAAALVFLAIASTRPAAHIPGVFAFFLLGLGLGQVTTTVNLLSALRFHEPRRRSAALSLLNFTWSAGAVLSPLIAGFYLAHFTLHALFLTFVAFAAALAVALLFLTSRLPASQASQTPTRAAMPLRPLAYFFLIFLIYGGLEATLGGWLSTYTLRYTTLGIAAAAYSTTVLWAAFAIGRAIAAILLRTLPERAVRSAGILLALVATIALRGAHTGLQIGLCAACIGLGIGPFFAVTFSLLIAHRPSPRQAGAATSNIGLGSAIFPYLTGVVSTRAGSLQTAMLTPIATAIFLLALCSLKDRPATPH